MENRTFVILAADDEEELLEALQLFLEREHMKLIKAADGPTALRLFEKEQPDLVLLDVMMPGMDGFAVLRRIREKSRIPALMMTARTEDYDKILGLELGADDYITKPYNPLEVVARVKAQLRRCYAYQEQKSEETEVLKARRNPETESYWQLSFGKRQEEELYNISEDRECIANLAKDANYNTLKKQMRSELLQKLAKQQDPRMLGQGDIFDSYLYMGSVRDAWNRIKKGESVPARSINKSDFEPEASGLEVNF